MGPRNIDTSHQANPLRPLDCAKPALMSDSVNQPTAYSLVFCICMKFATSRLSVHYNSPERLEELPPRHFLRCGAIQSDGQENLGEKERARPRAQQRPDWLRAQAKSTPPKYATVAVPITRSPQSLLPTHKCICYLSSV